jgi:hypothetical protein
MEVIIGGKTYPIASLKLVDVRDLGKIGVVKKMVQFVELEPWEQTDAIAEIIATSVRRAGTYLTADELLAAADPPDRAKFLPLVGEILKASGFMTSEAIADPNGQSPGTTT